MGNLCGITSHGVHSEPPQKTRNINVQVCPPGSNKTDIPVITGTDTCITGLFSN